MPGEPGSDEQPSIEPAPQNTTANAESPVPSVSVDHQPTSKEKTLLKPHFKFILGKHETKEDAERRLQAIENCDVIANETVGGDTEERIDTLSFWQEIADEPKNSPRALELLEMFQDSSEYHRYLAQGLNGTGKTILFIDMNEDDPNYHLIQEGRSAWETYCDSVNERQDLPTILSKLRNYTDRIAEANKARETVVIEQLKILGKHFEGKNDISVAVMEGRMHTQPSHQMHHDGFSTSREFIKDGTFGERGIGQRMYDWGYQAIRQKIFLPNKPVTDNFLKRVVVEDIYESSDKSPEEVKSFSKALEKMPEEEVDAMLARYLTLEPSAANDSDNSTSDREDRSLKSRREQPPPRK